MTVKPFSLGPLANSSSFHSPLSVSSHDFSFLKACLRKMMLIRAVEQRLAIARRDGCIGGPVHLGVGQEAVAVGVSANLRNSDCVFGAHRSHSHLLALGGDVRKLFAEVLGKCTGHSKGMGGSMHLFDQTVGFYGSVPIVAGTVSLAVGAGMAARIKNTDDVSIAYFGDGACEEGIVHESFNLASIQNDPVIFVVENNLFASHMHISTRQPMDSTARFAEANDIPFCIVDGNDVLAVSKASAVLVEAARQGNGPGFLEAVTYRWFGHVDWREDIDVGVNRSKLDVDSWRAKDPIRRLKDGMIDAGVWSQEQNHALDSAITAEVEEAWLLAVADPYPQSSSLLDYVYSIPEA